MATLSREAHHLRLDFGQASRRSIAILLLFSPALASWSCSGIHCLGSKESLPTLSVHYIHRGAVGFIQEVDLYEDGRVRLLGADWKTYCARLPQDVHAELKALLAEESFLASLENFGIELSCPEYLLFEELTIRHKAYSRTARIDGLSNKLIALIEILELGLQKVFEDAYQISIVERLAELNCEPTSGGQ